MNRPYNHYFEGRGDLSCFTLPEKVGFWEWVVLQGPETCSGTENFIEEVRRLSPIGKESEVILENRINQHEVSYRLMLNHYGEELIKAYKDNPDFTQYVRDSMAYNIEAIEKIKTGKYLYV